MAENPQRSWAKTNIQLWSLAMRDPIPSKQQYNNNNNSFSSNNSQNISRKPGEWRDICCWRYNKNRCDKRASECKFQHRCSHCGSQNHIYLNCNRRKRNSESSTTLRIPVTNRTTNTPPLYYKNFDLTSVVTPIKVDKFEEMLKDSNYPQQKIKFLISGFRQGFEIGYEGDRNIQLTSQNLRLHVGNQTELWNKVMKEVSLKRFAGPFSEIPFKNYIQSPIGLVPKGGGRATRLIFHLSHPRNSQLPNRLMQIRQKKRVQLLMQTLIQRYNYV